MADNFLDDDDDVACGNLTKRYSDCLARGGIGIVGLVIVGETISGPVVH